MDSCAIAKVVILQFLQVLWIKIIFASQSFLPQKLTQLFVGISLRKKKIKIQVVGSDSEKADFKIKKKKKTPSTYLVESHIPLVEHNMTIVELIKGLSSSGSYRWQWVLLQKCIWTSWLSTSICKIHSSNKECKWSGTWFWFVHRAGIHITILDKMKIKGCT